MVDIHRSSLTRSNSEMLQSSKYSDMTILCGSEEFKIHRAIVCPRSSVLAAACDGRKFWETETPTLILNEDDPAAIGRMLTYIYTLDYTDEGPVASAQHYMVSRNAVAASQAPVAIVTPLSDEELLRHNKMMNNVVVCAIAQKYHISELRELATAKFSDLLWLGKPSHSLRSIIGAVFETSSTTNPGLRSVAAHYYAYYSTEILADDRLCSIIKDYDELGLEVLRVVDDDAVEVRQKKKLLKKKLVRLRSQLEQMLKDVPSGRPAVTAQLMRLRATLKADDEDSNSSNSPEPS